MASSARSGVRFALTVAWGSFLFTACATTEDVDPSKLNRGGGANVGGALGSGGSTANPSGGTSTGNGGAVGNGGASTGNGGAVGNGGAIFGSGGSTFGSGGSSFGNGGASNGNGGAAPGAGGKVFGNTGGTSTGKGGAATAGSTASGGKIAGGGSTGTAGGTGTGECDFTACDAMNCMAGCPANDGGYCAKACGDFVTCFQMNEGCSKPADPLCVLRPPQTGTPNVCTMKWESAGGQQSGPATSGPSLAAAKYIACACPDLTIPGVM
jgi:hypothetical protein